MEVKQGYKSTEVGVIPEDWEVVFLGDCAKFRTGPFGSALHKSDYTENGIPVINPMHIFDGKIEPTQTMTITEAAANGLSDYRVKVGEIVIGRRGEMGRCAIVQSHQAGWLCGTGSMIIRCDGAAVGGFVQRLLSSPSTIAAIENASVGTTMVNLNHATLAGLRIAFPSASEQYAIATALRDVDALLDALVRLIAKKRDLKQAAMQQLLTGQSRLPGFHGEWETMRLGECASFRTGPFGSALHKSDYTDDGVPVVNPMHIVEGRIESTRTMTVTEAAARSLADFRLKPGEIVMGRRGDMGRCAVVQPHQSGWLCGTGSMIIRTESSVPDFLQRVLSSPRAIAAIEETSVGITMINLNQSTLARLELQFPTLAEQKAIAEVLSEMDAELITLQQRRAKTRALKQGMMQELLTGRTRLV